MSQPSTSELACPPPAADERLEIASVGIRFSLARRQWMGLLLVGLLGPVAGLVGWLPAVAALVPAAVCALLVLANIAIPSWPARPVQVTSRDVSSRGNIVARRADILSATLVECRDGLAVRLEPRSILRRVIEIPMRDRDEGNAALEALRLDARHRVAAFRALPAVTSPVIHQIAYFSLLTTILGGGAFTLLSEISRVPDWIGLAVLATTLGMLLLGALIPSHVVVGSDGIRLEWLVWERFVRFQDVDRIERGQGLVRFHMRSGRPLVIRFAEGGKPLVERLDQAMRFARAGGPTAPESRVLSRSRESTTEWVRRLRTALPPEPDFRTPPLDAERLWQLVEDRATDATQRGAAAVALSARLDPQARDRLRVVAQASAERPLRIMLEAAAAEDEAAMVEALSELESERARR